MEDHSNLNLFQVFNNWARTFFKLLSGFKSLVTLEARLAKKSLVTIIILLVLMACLLAATWISLLALIVAALLSIHFSLLSSLALIVLLNIFLILVMGIAVLKLKNNLFFPVTRKQLGWSRFKKKESNDGKLKTKN